jgi:hypothetical protein
VARSSLICVFSLAASLLVANGGSPRAIGDANRLIAFTSVRSGGAFELYTIRGDGSGQRRLTRNDPDARSPRGVHKLGPSG